MKAMQALCSLALSEIEYNERGEASCKSPVTCNSPALLRLWEKKRRNTMPGYRIGSLGGFDVYINVSWLIAIVLITFSTASGWFPSVYPGQSTITYFLLGFFSAILLFVSVLLHEFAHSLVARARGITVKYIVLFIFGGVSTFEQEAKTPGTEFLVAIVGPLTSLLIGALAYLLLLPLRGVPSAATAILSYLAVV